MTHHYGEDRREEDDRIPILPLPRTEPTLTPSGTMSDATLLAITNDVRVFGNAFVHYTPNDPPRRLDPTTVTITTTLRGRDPRDPRERAVERIRKGDPLVADLCAEANALEAAVQEKDLMFHREWIRANAAEATLARVAAQAAEDLWVVLQRDYRQSKATPPERSLGCEWCIERLRTLAIEVEDSPDPRAVVEIGMEHLWKIVYGVPYPDEKWTMRVGDTVLPAAPMIPRPEDVTPEHPHYFGDEGFEMVVKDRSTHTGHVTVSRGDSTWTGPVGPEPVLRTPREWGPITGIHIMDPDGWHRSVTGPGGTYEPRDFDDPISVSEFRTRAMWSTAKRTKPEWTPSSMTPPPLDPDQAAWVLGEEEAP